MMPPGCKTRARGDPVVACLVATLFALGHNEELYLFLALILFQRQEPFGLSYYIKVQPRQECNT